MHRIVLVVQNVSKCHYFPIFFFERLQVESNFSGRLNESRQSMQRATCRDLKRKQRITKNDAIFFAIQLNAKTMIKINRGSLARFNICFVVQFGHYMAHRAHKIEPTN